MDLLWEMGRAKEITPKSCEAMLASIRRFIKPHFLSWEYSEPIDVHRDILCHCGWGTIYQVLRAAGVDVEKELPGVRPWFLKYQLPDGGWNCYEEAYKGSKKSSIVSTVPVLESMLEIPNRTKEEDESLDRGAAYLIKRKLVNSSSGKLLNHAWLKPYFPRFYDYDELRGLSFIVRWSRHRKIPIPKEMDEAIARQKNPPPPGRPDWLGIGTIRLDSGQWTRRKKCMTTPLLEKARNEAPKHLARLRSELGL
jgi:hypothetical protein